MHFHFRKKAMSLLRVNHRWFALVVFFSVFCLGLLVGKPVLASPWDPFWNLIGSGLLMLIKLLGKLLVVVIDILIKVASYDNFIKSAAVVKGWIVLRDTCNMFFIIILLISAFYTVLSIEKYSYKRLLPTLLIMAVLINFSKTIAGFFIDMAQVAMMTFVNGFKFAAAGNLTTAFGLQDLLKYRNDVKELDVSDTVLSLIMALVMLLIAVLVTGVIVVVFIVRIIALWILVVVSPIAYLAHASPGGQKYSSMWWSNFGKYVTIGPTLAFFLWLSLAVMGDPDDLEAMKKMGESSENLSEEARSAITVSASKATSSENMLGFAISIAMLMGALMAAQQLGGVAGSLAGKMSGRITGVAGKALKAPLKLPGKVKDTGVAMLSKSKKMQDFLGGVAGATGVGGVFAKITGARALATKGYVGLRRIQKREKDKAEAYVRSIGDMRILKRMGTQTAITPMQFAIRNAVRTRTPSAVGWDKDFSKRDRDAMQDAYNDLDEEVISKLSREEWYRLASTNVDLTKNSLGLDLLTDPRRGAAQRGAVEKGLDDLMGYGATINTDTDDMWTNDIDAKDLRKAPYSFPGQTLTNPRGTVDTRYMPVEEEVSQQAVRYGRTKEEIEKYKTEGKTVEDFYKDKDARVKEGKYLPKEEFERLDKAVEAKEMEVKAGKIVVEGEEEAIREKEKVERPDAITGANRFLREGAEGMAARLALSFEKFGLKGVGANMVGKDKDAMTDKIVAALKQEGRSTEETNKIEQGLRSAPSLQLINRGRENVRQVISHEAAHDYVDSLGEEKQKEILERADEKELDTERERIRETWVNGDKMSTQAVDGEVLANMFTNETRYGRKEGIKLDQKTRNELQEQGLHDGKNFKPLQAQEQAMASLRARMAEAGTIPGAEVKPGKINLGPDAEPIRAELDTQALAKSIGEGVKEGFKSMEQIVEPLNRMRQNSDRMLREELYNRRSLKVLEELRNRISNLQNLASQIENPNSIEGKALVEELEDLSDSLKE